MPENETKPRGAGETVIQVKLPGVIVFSVALVAASALLTYGLIRGLSLPRTSAQAATRVASRADRLPGDTDAAPPHETPPWGELITYDIELEQPEEYAAFELDAKLRPIWAFEGMTPENVRRLLGDCGLAPDLVAQLMSAAVASGSNTTLNPSDEMVLALPAEARAKLYRSLARFPSNQHMVFPWAFPGQSFDTRFPAGEVADASRDLLKRLLYDRDGVPCFSDYETALTVTTNAEERARLVRLFSRQPAVLARLRVRHDTDIDKVLGYWDRGIQTKDVRPMLEALKRLPEGGTMSLLYLLPRFARERLYTFPMPAQPGDPAMDCHWSTMNFFRTTPDDRFGDPSYTAPYLTTNYFRVARPSQYGDVVLFLNEQGNAIHSGVYLADDIIFTKNGNNSAQPWRLMRLKEMMTLYGLQAQARVAAYRSKTQ